MNTKEMIYLFEEIIGTLDATLAKPKTTDTVEWLNLAQEELYYEAYTVFESDENARKILAPFINIDYEIDTFVAQTGSFGNAVSITLPVTCRYVLREEMEVNVDLYGRIAVALAATTIKPVKPVGIDYYNTNKDNPYRKPSYKESWRVDFKYFDAAGLAGNVQLLVMAEGVIPEVYYLTYIHDTTALTDSTSSTSLFPIWFHDTIVKRAVSLYARARTVDAEPVKQENIE